MTIAGRLLNLGVIAILLAPLAVASGCGGDTGRFDEGEVSAQAVSHMAEKYGGDYDVVALWEDKSYSLFSYSSFDRVFCEMSDGTQVIVPIGENAGEPLLDNKQSYEICEEVYDAAIAEAVESGVDELEGRGYSVSGALVNGLSPEAFDSSRCVSRFDWESPEDAEGEAAEPGSAEGIDRDSIAGSLERYDREVEKETPFFHAKYEGDAAAFLEAESAVVDLSNIDVEYAIAGPDADYQDGVPVDAPTVPAWEEPLDGVADSLSGLCANRYFGDVAVYQAQDGGGFAFDGDSRLLGELRCLGDSRSWLVVDWLYLGKGVWATSDEHGVRLEDGDLSLAVEDGADHAAADLEGYFRSDYPRAFDQAAFERYSISLDEGKAKEIARQDEDIEKYRWFSARIAYDNGDPACGLPEGVAVSSLSPSLYQAELEEPDSAGPEAGREDPVYDFSGLNVEPMSNGWQCGRLVVRLDEPASYFRM